MVIAAVSLFNENGTKEQAAAKCLVNSACPALECFRDGRAISEDGVEFPGDILACKNFAVRRMTILKHRFGVHRGDCARAARARRQMFRRSLQSSTASPDEIRLRSRPGQTR